MSTSRIGRTAIREASVLGAQTVAFAPLIHDQGNSVLPAGEIGTIVLKNMLLAYDTNNGCRQKDWPASTF